MPQIAKIFQSIDMDYLLQKSFIIHPVDSSVPMWYQWAVWGE